MNQFESKLLLDARASLGEGPAWDSVRNILWWVNINDGELHAFDPADCSDQCWQLGQAVGCAVPAADGSMIVGLKAGLARIDPLGSVPDIQPNFLAQPESDLPQNRWNDGKVGPDGRLISGTMDINEKARSGSLYSFSAAEGLRTLRTNVGIANGIAWSPDGATMYWIDTPSSTILAFDYDRSSGAIANERVVIRVPSGLGWPDGMTSDRKGRLWVGLWGGSVLSVWDPNRGTLVDTLPIPAKNVTSCCFGGPDFNQLYITTARTNTDEGTLRRFPNAGGLFRLNAGVEGMPTWRYGEIAVL